MSTNFGNSEGVVFGQLGLTSTLTGITLKTTLYDSVTGQTAFTAISPTALNYVVGSDLSGTIVGTSYQTMTNGIVSLTTAASRMVQIDLKSTAVGAFVTYSGIDNTSNVGYFRILRGPSTVVDGSVFQYMTPNSGGVGATSFFYRFPPSMFRYYDLSPITGAATYILQAQTGNVDTGIVTNSVALFVRQI